MPTRETILILQIGSLGDTVISLPCYREIARRHPAAEKLLLTNHPIGSKMVPAEAILLPTGLISGSIAYSMPLRSLGEMIRLVRAIRARKPSRLIYLMPETRRTNLLRHLLFFKLCGVPKIEAMPWTADLRYPREIEPGRLWESEASRLLRTLGLPGGPPVDPDRDLSLSRSERAKACAVLADFAPQSFVAVSVGGKIPLNNWGEENWRAMLTRLSMALPNFGVVLVGSADERSRNDELATAWIGPSLNTCGQLSPRETAALIERARVFIGHDTGTLHLAAAVDTPVIGIFSARNRAGKWYSDRQRDIFFYDYVACAGCELVDVEDCPRNRICMAEHSPERVAEAAVQLALTDLAPVDPTHP